jgi:hypothetical protein
MTPACSRRSRTGPGASHVFTRSPEFPRPSVVAVVQGPRRSPPGAGGPLPVVAAPLQVQHVRIVNTFLDPRLTAGVEGGMANKVHGP